MSSLPQRKKSPEELAALRKELGISHGKEEVEEKAELPQEEVTVEEPNPTLREIKPVRSLKRSEREALPAGEISSKPLSNAKSGIPARRRSEKELMQLRLQGLGAPQASPYHPRLLPAHWVIICLGYLSGAFQFASYYFFQLPIAAPIAAGVLALGIASWMFFFRQGSRHHSALIVMIVLVSSAFAALHYFPEINYGS